MRSSRSASRPKRGTQASEDTLNICTADAQPSKCSACNIEGLPGEVLQVIGSHLPATDLISARSACRFWAQHITQAIDEVAVLLHPDDLIAKQKLEHITKLTPRIRQLHVSVSGRVTQKAFDAYVSHLKALSFLRNITLHFKSPLEPKYMLGGTSIISYAVLTHLPNVQSITVIDGPIPKQSDYQKLALSGTLTKLRLVQTERGMDPALLDVHEDMMFVHYHDLKHVALLTSLEDLEIHAQVSPTHDSSRHLTALTRLTSLCLGGGLIMASCVSFITKLPNLQTLDLKLDMRLGPGLKQSGLDKLKSLSSLSLELLYLGDLSEDLPFLNNRMAGKLQKLVLRGRLICPEEMQQIASLSSLKHLEILEPYGSDEDDLHEVDLRPLSQLTSLHTFKYCKRHSELHIPHDLLLNYTLGEMTVAWASCLQHLSLNSMISGDLTPAAMRTLGSLTQLRTLSIRAADYTMALLQVGVDTLPTQLERLDLRYAHLACGNHSRLADLQHLGLSQCSVGCLPHFQNLLEELPSLSSLELEDIQGMEAEHVAALSRLTQLTKLGVMAVGNMHITHGALAPLTTLRSLRELKWFTGDLLDSPPDPSVLKAFTGLFKLHLQTALFYRMQRWSALPVLEFLPHCQIETS